LSFLFLAFVDFIELSGFFDIPGVLARHSPREWQFAKVQRKGAAKPMTQQHAKYGIGAIIQTATFGMGRINQVCPQLQGGLGIRYQMVTTTGETRFVHESSIVKVIDAGAVNRDEAYEEKLTNEFEDLFKRHQGERVGGDNLIIDLTEELEAIFDGPEENFPEFFRQAA
jgi:hypothetical protein